MKLKIYQQEALNTLTSFCKNYKESSGKVEEAFNNTLKNSEQFSEPYEPYLKVKESTAPYICIRIPTGGGKTLIAAKSLKPVIEELYENDKTFLVIWLAPKDIIVNQTIKALKDPKHPYRKAIDEDFPSTSINVMKLKDALTNTFNKKTDITILVGSMQSFNVGNDDIRKFYYLNSNYANFLENSKYKDEPSLANAIKEASPYIIIDEAHKARANLSLSNIINLNPSFVLELTATPERNHKPNAGKYASNIIYSVSASQLKAENMIKLPIILETVDNWEKTVKYSKDRRENLDALTITEKKYIRPIVLFRAEPDRNEDSITYEKIKNYLLKIGVKENEIVIATGSIKELDNISSRGCKSIEDKECPVKYIITVDALKEGWDCPFAYVLGVVSDLSSSTSVEQLLGRILRNPYVEQKENEELNYSYAIVSSKKFQETAQTLKDQLIDNGFEEIEANLSIIKDPHTNPEASSAGGLFAIDNLYNDNSIDVLNFDIEQVSIKNREAIDYNNVTKKFTLYKRPINLNSLKKELKVAIQDENEYKKVEKLIDESISNKIMRISKDEDFSIPLLTIKNDQGIFEVFEESHIQEHVNWTEEEFITQAFLTEDEFHIEENSTVESIDIDSKTKKVVINPLKERLVHFSKNQLFKTNIEPRDIIKVILSNNSKELNSSPSKSIQKFASHIIRNLIDNGYSIDDLYIYRIKLKKAIMKKIKDTNQLNKTKYFNSLFDNFDFEVSPNIQFTFSKQTYPTSNIDARSSEFKKHYYPNRIQMLGKKEEYECAKYIDKLENVETWIRNIDRRPDYSFWLQTSTDKFYPDFILKLINGKILVIEYKGEDRTTNDDSKEKNKIGSVWEDLNPNVGFVMVSANDYMHKIKNKIHRLLH